MSLHVFVCVSEYVCLFCVSLFVGICVSVFECVCVSLSVNVCLCLCVYLYHVSVCIVYLCVCMCVLCVQISTTCPCAHASGRQRRMLDIFSMNSTISLVFFLDRKLFPPTSLCCKPLLGLHISQTPKLWTSHLLVLLHRGSCSMKHFAFLDIFKA